MNNKLLSAFNGATQEEKNELIAAISGQQGTGSEVYAAMKQIESEREAKASKQEEYDRGERLRQDSAEKARRMFPNT